MRNEIKAIIEKLRALEPKVQTYLIRAQEDSNENREETLQNELDSIQEAIEALENIE